MTLNAMALRELHRIHRQLTDLRDRLDRGPRQIRARQASVQQAQDALSQAKEDIKSARMSVDRKQMDLKSGETKILDLQTKLNTCGSNKEYQALQDQIAAADMANSVLADEILEGLEEIDQLEIESQTAAQAVEATQAELAKAETEVAAQAQLIQADIDRLEEELETAEKTLPSDFRMEYDRIISAKGEDALAPLDGEHCGGCFQSITPNQQNALFMGRSVFCTSCGRLIYLPEGREPAGR